MLRALSLLLWPGVGRGESQPLLQLPCGGDDMRSIGIPCARCISASSAAFLGEREREGGSSPPHFCQRHFQESVICSHKERVCLLFIVTAANLSRGQVGFEVLLSWGWGRWARWLERCPSCLSPAADPPSWKQISPTCAKQRGRGYFQMQCKRGGRGS